MTSRYKKSEEQLKRALKCIPLGSQTFSKSMTALPYGVSPYFVDRALGSHFWDVDGNKFIDFVNGLCCVTLGYKDADVDMAVRKQMENGVTFSLPHKLESDVAELLVEMIPSAQMVRFAKNGSDATSGAIRLARAYTGRERIAVCGYHGWHDWYIGSTTRDLGVPKCVKDLTHSFQYNDLESLVKVFREHPGEFAAVILEPMNTNWPEKRFLEDLREFTQNEGSLLVFDETITGFRYHLGGAQEYFGVIPDLSTLGKGMANGYPLSALVGKSKYMEVMEDIFFSGTFGGETLSLAAAKAVLIKLRNKPVLETLKIRGQQILDGVSKIITDNKLNKVVSICGHPAWSFVQFKECPPYSNMEIKTFFLQEVFKRGIYTLGSHNISYAHSEQDIEQLLACYEEVFHAMARVIKESNLSKQLKCDPLIPLFKVR
jgi:glutamate-1-semialdehyde 2,1-aminomutase